MTVVAFVTGFIVALDALAALPLRDVSSGPRLRAPHYLSLLVASCSETLSLSTISISF